jgi:hypothetical protein
MDTDDDLEIKIYKPLKQTDIKARVIPKRLPQVPFRALLCGFSGSGKSNLIKNFLFNKAWGYNSYFDSIIVICGSADDVGEYTRLAKTTNVPIWWEEKNRFYKTKHEKLIEKMVITQSADEADLKEIIEELETNEPDNATLLILDDMVVDKLFRNKVKPNVVDEIYVRGRHIGKGLSVIVSTQKYMLMSQNIRYTNSTQLMLYFGMSSMDLDVIARENGYEYDALLALMNNLAPDKFMFMTINQKAPREKAIQDMKWKYVRIGSEE